MYSESSESTVEMTPESGSSRSDYSLRRLAWVVVLVMILALALVAAVSVFLLRNPARTETVRDIVIIWIALEALVIGVVLITLAIQVTRLIVLLRHEIKPILEDTGDTIKTLRGTARFVSENIAEPVVKISGTVAGIQRFLRLLAPGWITRRRRR